MAITLITETTERLDTQATLISYAKQYEHLSSAEQYSEMRCRAVRKALSTSALMNILRYSPPNLNNFYPPFPFAFILFGRICVGALFLRCSSRPLFYCHASPCRQYVFFCFQKLRLASKLSDLCRLGRLSVFSALTFMWCGRRRRPPLLVLIHHGLQSLLTKDLITAFPTCWCKVVSSKWPLLVNTGEPYWQH